MAELMPIPSPRPAPKASARVGRLAEEQWGVVGVGQLAACGVGSDRITRWLRDGRLFRIHPGVYAVGRRSLPLEGRLAGALLYAGPDAALSHATAAWWWQVVPAQPQRIQVSSLGRSRSAPTIEVHHPRRLQRTRHRRLPVTTVARTLLDVAAGLTFSQLRRALAEAEYRRLLDPSAVEAVLGRGRHGSTALRTALDAHLPELGSTLSVLEERFLALCESSRIPLPEVNTTICGLMVDGLWRRQRLVVELDGHRSHGTPAAIERDRRREISLRAAGYLVLRYTWRQVTREPELVAADLRAALAGTDPITADAPRRAPARLEEQPA